MELRKNGKMSWSAKTYIKNVMKRVKTLMEKFLKSWESTMTEECHPELDNAPYWKALRWPSTRC